MSRVALKNICVTLFSNEVFLYYYYRYCMILTELLNFYPKPHIVFIVELP